MGVPAPHVQGCLGHAVHSAQTGRLRLAHDRLHPVLERGHGDWLTSRTQLLQAVQG